MRIDRFSIYTTEIWTRVQWFLQLNLQIGQPVLFAK